MFLGGWFFALGIMAVFVSVGTFTGPFPRYIYSLTLIALGGTIIESLPLKDVDNLTITGVALLLGHYFLP
jgi:phytol kinase